jgi:hypothetical protein
MFVLQLSYVSTLQAVAHRCHLPLVSGITEISPAGETIYGTTRIGALHDGSLSSYTVENASRLTYYDDQKFCHESHVIILLDRLEPSRIANLIRHGIHGQQQ